MMLNLWFASGTRNVTASTKSLSGRALYVTAFDANDADSRGMLIRRSPIAETRLDPNTKRVKLFLNLHYRTYILSCSFESLTLAQKDDYVSASGSGGFGHAKENPISVSGTVKGINITRAAPMMMQPKTPNGGTNGLRKPPQLVTQALIEVHT